MAARGFDHDADIDGSGFLNSLPKPRAATEGRPYSMFDSARADIFLTASFAGDSGLRARLLLHCPVFRLFRLRFSVVRLWRRGTGFFE